MIKKNFLYISLIFTLLLSFQFCSKAKVDIKKEFKTLASEYETQMKKKENRSKKKKILSDYRENLKVLITGVEKSKLTETENLTLGKIYYILDDYGLSEKVYGPLLKSADKSIQLEAFQCNIDLLLKQKKVMAAYDQLKALEKRFTVNDFLGQILRTGVSLRNKDLAKSLELIDIALAQTIPANEFKALYSAVHIKFVDGELTIEQQFRFLEKMKVLYKKNKPLVSQIDRKLHFLRFLGQPVPQINGEGKWINLAEAEFQFKGKYTLIDFFAPWCPDCRKSMPGFLELYKKNKDKLNILMVSKLYGFYADEDTKAIRDIPAAKETEYLEKYIKKKGIKVPVFISIKGKAFEDFHVASIPHYVLVSPEGNVQLLCMERIHDFFKRVEKIINKSSEASF